MHNLSRWRITLQSQWIKEVIRAAGPAAEIPDNVLQQLLNWGDGGEKSCFHIILKESVIIYEPINAQHSLHVPDLAGLVTMEMLSWRWSSALLNRDLYVCAWGDECYTQTDLHVFLSPRHPGIVSSCPLWLLILGPNNKYAGMKKLSRTTRRHTKALADFFPSCSKRYFHELIGWICIRWFVFCFPFSFWICCRKKNASSGNCEIFTDQVLVCIHLRLWVCALWSRE